MALSWRGALDEGADEPVLIPALSIFAADCAARRVSIIGDPEGAAGLAAAFLAGAFFFAAGSCSVEGHMLKEGIPL